MHNRVVRKTAIGGWRRDGQNEGGRRLEGVRLLPRRLLDQFSRPQVAPECCCEVALSAQAVVDCACAVLGSAQPVATKRAHAAPSRLAGAWAQENASPTCRVATAAFESLCRRAPEQLGRPKAVPIPLGSAWSLESPAFMVGMSIYTYTCTFTNLRCQMGRICVIADSGASTR